MQSSEVTQGSVTFVMANVTNSLDAAMQLPGAIAVGLMDMETGKCVAGCGNERLDLGAAAERYTDILRTILRDLLNLHEQQREQLHEVMLTCFGQIHLLRLVQVKGGAGLFLFLALDRKGGNANLVRFKLASIEQELTL